MEIPQLQPSAISNLSDSARTTRDEAAVRQMAQEFDQAIRLYKKSIYPNSSSSLCKKWSKLPITSRLVAKSTGSLNAVRDIKHNR